MTAATRTPLTWCCDQNSAILWALPRTHSQRLLKYASPQKRSFAQTARVTAQQESKELYPALEGDTEPAAKAISARFGLEMKQKLPELAEFNRRWPGADAIRSNGHQFIKEMDPILVWLDKRFIAENNELYPLLDKQDLARMAIVNNPDLKIARI